MSRSLIYLIETGVPLVLLMAGGIFLSCERKARLLYHLAERVDRMARVLHDCIADELDRLSVADR
jgi:hypothetical protein